MYFFTNFFIMAAPGITFATKIQEIQTKIDLWKNYKELTSNTTLLHIFYTLEIFLSSLLSSPIDSSIFGSFQAKKIEIAYVWPTGASNKVELLLRNFCPSWQMVVFTLDYPTTPVFTHIILSSLKFIQFYFIHLEAARMNTKNFDKLIALLSLMC